MPVRGRSPRNNKHIHWKLKSLQNDTRKHLGLITYSGLCHCWIFLAHEIGIWRILVEFRDFSRLRVSSTTPYAQKRCLGLVWARCNAPWPLRPPLGPLDPSNRPKFARFRWIRHTQHTIGFSRGNLENPKIQPDIFLSARGCRGRSGGLTSGMHAVDRC